MVGCLTSLKKSWSRFGTHFPAGSRPPASAQAQRWSPHVTCETRCPSDLCRDLRSRNRPHFLLEICWTRRRDMAVSFRGLSLSAHSEGLSEVDKNSGEPENTYILRPIFQQRRVADRARRAMWGWGRGFWMRELP